MWDTLLRTCCDLENSRANREVTEVERPTRTSWCRERRSWSGLCTRKGPLPQETRGPTGVFTEGGVTGDIQDRMGRTILHLPSSLGVCPVGTGIQEGCLGCPKGLMGSGACRCQTGTPGCGVGANVNPEGRKTHKGIHLHRGGQAVCGGASGRACPVLTPTRSHSAFPVARTGGRLRKGTCLALPSSPGFVRGAERQSVAVASGSAQTGDPFTYLKGGGCAPNIRSACIVDTGDTSDPTRGEERCFQSTQGSGFEYHLPRMGSCSFLPILYFGVGVTASPTPPSHTCPPRPCCLRFSRSLQALLARHSASDLPRVQSEVWAADTPQGSFTDGLLLAPRAAGPDSLPRLWFLFLGVTLASLQGVLRLTENERSRHMAAGS